MVPVDKRLDVERNKSLKDISQGITKMTKAYEEFSKAMLKFNETMNAIRIELEKRNENASS